MRTSPLHRIALSVVIVTVGTLAGTACSDMPQPPTAIGTHEVLPLHSLVPSAHATVIRQRVADKRARRLDADEVARVQSLRGHWQWAADLHHAVMQEAIHDPSLGGLRQRHTAAERCAIVLRYLKKHYPEVEARSGRPKSGAERVIAIHSVAERAGACPQSQSQASLFARPLPSRTSGAHPGASVISTANGTVSTEQVAAAWRDYVVPMIGDIRAATDLGDAIEIMDRYLATASADPDVSPISLALIAGTIDLTTSSANEWDAFARPREGSMFLWGWLSGLGDWVANVVVSDASGCATEAEFYLGAVEWTSFVDFMFAAEASCGLGGLAFSVLAAI